MLFRLLALALCAFSVFAQKKPITLETLTARSGARRSMESPLEWAPDGKHFAYFKGKQIMLYDVAAKSEKELLALEPLEKAAVPVPTAERFDFQNRRVSENRFQWSPSGKELLLSVSGDLFWYHVESGHWDH